MSAPKQEVHRHLKRQEKKEKAEIQELRQKYIWIKRGIKKRFVPKPIAEKRKKVADISAKMIANQIIPLGDPTDRSGGELQTKFNPFKISLAYFITSSLPLEVPADLEKFTINQAKQVVENFLKSLKPRHFGKIEFTANELRKLPALISQSLHSMLFPEILILNDSSSKTRLNLAFFQKLTCLLRLFRYGITKNQCKVGIWSLLTNPEYAQDESLYPIQLTETFVLGLSETEYAERFSYATIILGGEGEGAGVVDPAQGKGYGTEDYSQIVMNGILGFGQEKVKTICTFSQEKPPTKGELEILNAPPVDFGISKEEIDRWIALSFHALTGQLIATVYPEIFPASFKLSVPLNEDGYNEFRRKDSDCVDIKENHELESYFQADTLASFTCRKRRLFFNYKGNACPVSEKPGVSFDDRKVKADRSINPNDQAAGCLIWHELRSLPTYHNTVSILLKSRGHTNSSEESHVKLRTRRKNMPEG